MSIPKRGHETDAGIDLTAMSVEQKRPDVFFFDTGISIHVSDGYYVEIVPRSSITKTDFIRARADSDSSALNKKFSNLFQHTSHPDPYCQIQQPIDSQSLLYL